MKNYRREMKKFHAVGLVSLLGLGLILNEPAPLVRAWISSSKALSKPVTSDALITAQQLPPPRNLRATTSGNSVTLNWDLPTGGRMGEGQIGSQGGAVTSVDGTVTVIVPPGGLTELTSVRVTSIPIQEFHDEVVARGITPVGEPLEGAAVIEVEAPRMNLPALVEITTPQGVSPTDPIIFSQLLPDQLRYWGLGTFSEDGSRIRSGIPINPEQGLPGAAEASAALASQRQFNFLREIQGNGIDDDGDGLVDEMELYFYPDRMATGLCQVTGAVTFSNGVPAVGAIVSILGTTGLPLIDIADGFGRYILPIQAPVSPGSASFTVRAIDQATGLAGVATGSCSAGGTAVVNVTLDTTAPPNIVVTITSPEDGATLDTNVPTIMGTVSDSTVTRVEILINGLYPPVVGTVTNGAFSVQVFLGLSTNSLVALARNPAGQIGSRAITVNVRGNITEPPDLQVSLQWDRANDVDLYVVTPAGNVIWFANRSADGGSLNIDQISGTASGPEIITFPARRAQPGRYGIAVQFFNSRGLGATAIELSIVVRGRSLGVFQNVLEVADSSPLSRARTLADVNPASVWNVTSVDLPAGVLAPPRPLAEFVLRPGSASKVGAASTDLTYKRAEEGEDPMAAMSKPAPHSGFSETELEAVGSTLPSQATLQSFNIYRSTAPNARATGTVVANVNASTTTFTDMLPVGTPFYYQVTAVYDQGESGPSNEVSVTVGAPGPNDSCSNATQITMAPFTQTLDTTTATSSPDDPLQACTVGGPGRNSNSVWYQFTPSQNGTVTADTFGSNYDTVLSASTGTCGALTEIACSDDAVGTLQSRITFNATAGATYLIEITQFGNPKGGTLVFFLNFVGGGGQQDTTPPTVRIITPADNASLSGRVTIVAEASDNVGVVGVQFKADGRDIGSEVLAAPFELSFDTATLGNGQHPLTAEARDAAGNRATSAPVRVTVTNRLTRISGNRSGTLTLGESPYLVTDDLFVPSGQTLTIEPGVVLQFQNPNTALVIDGTLIANGTPIAPITFTSDDAQRAPGQWEAIIFRDSSNDADTVMNYCIVEFAGAFGFADQSIRFESASPTITNCLVSNSRLNGMQFFASSPTVSNCRFIGNLGFAMAMRTDSFPRLQNNVARGNGRDEIAVFDFNVGRNGTWVKDNLPYTLLNDVFINNGITLTIEPGVTVQFQNPDTALFVDGTLIANGTPAARITFTSAAAQKAPGQWEAIVFRDTSNDAATIMNNCIVEFAGAFGFADQSIRFESVSPTITNCVISNGRLNGMQFFASSPTISNCRFIGNGGFAMAMRTDSFPRLQNNTAMGNGRDEIAVFDFNVGRNGTWVRDNLPYTLVNDVFINSGITLTIEPGVIVQLQNPDTGLFVDGTLIARGTAANPIRFTSDDAMKQPGQWEAIVFRDTSDDANTVMDHCIVEYGGAAGVANENIRFESASPTIINSTISNSRLSGITLLRSDPRIENCLFTNNGGFAIGMRADAFPRLQNNTAMGNGRNEIGVFDFNVNRNGTWVKDNLPYTLLNDVFINSGITLTIEPGVIVQFQNPDTALVVDGTLIANGTEAQPIRFTSDEAMKEPGQWEQIAFRDTSDDARSVMSHCLIEFGGANAEGSLTFFSASPQIMNCTISNSVSDGIHCNNSSPRITGCRITSNARDGVRTVNQANPTINNSAIFGNAQFGVRNFDTSQFINAKMNFWGDASGPLDDSNADGRGLMNPMGRGDRVSEHVDWQPFLSTDPTVPTP